MSDTPRTDKLFGGFAATDDGYWKVLDHARKLERELAAKDTEKYCFSSCAFFALRNELAAANAKADTARLDWLFQDAELNLFFADRAEIDAAMQEAVK